MWKDSKFLWLLTATTIAGILELLALFDIRPHPSLGKIFFSIFILGVGYSTLWSGLKAVLTLNFKNINALMLIAVLGAWYLGKYEEAAVVIVLYTLAEKLEDFGIDKSQSALQSLIQKMPKMVLLKDQNKAIPIEEAVPGDIVQIKPFEMIPLDGKIVKGHSYVDESTITGEPIPQDKFPGDAVYAGTLNKQGYLEVQVTKSARNTTFAKIQELTFQATHAKAPTQQFIEQFSKIYTPLIIGLALFWSFLPPLVLGGPIDPWLASGLALIVIACPCALVISTPISIYSALGNASKQGALIKGGKFLEALAQIQMIALDKTRTLTFGRPMVSDILPYGKNSKKDLLECAAGIEIFSEHPLAESIVEAAKKENLTFHPVQNFRSVVGKGAQADCLVCSVKHHCIGNLEFILEEHVVPPLIIEEVDRLKKAGKIPIIIATHQEVEGVIALTDEIRPESSPFIRELKALNIQPLMLTGDHEESARLVAQQLGIEEVRAHLLPEDKAQIIQTFIQASKKIAMVGDGVNDAPALALSNVGITMGSLGSDTAIEAASIVILNNRLDVIPYLIKLGRKTLKTVRMNIGFAILIKLIIIFLALFGISNLALAIFADIGVTILVILISLRLMHWKP